MAGNIIPAIATTNAVIAGLIVMEALKVLAGEFDKCKTVSLSSSGIASLIVLRISLCACIAVSTFITSLPASLLILTCSLIQLVHG